MEDQIMKTEDLGWGEGGPQLKKQRQRDIYNKDFCSLVGQIYLIGN